eukprot:3486295-Heterocapsa_arctica.AAC.1
MPGTDGPEVMPITPMSLTHAQAIPFAIPLATVHPGEGSSLIPARSRRWSWGIMGNQCQRACVR